jgi:hypothetical protein
MNAEQFCSPAFVPSSHFQGLPHCFIAQAAEIEK